ncbi:Phospho-N-acetylmuramoyl-pentapeptide-transferaseMurX [Mycobacteroides abscessus subsp. abscessus]|nr:Phospho-N-acetylmuramoyl-pentapeptide-transferaseMurX [Mycobacteroides abscessus subsp. abscessus]
MSWSNAVNFTDGLDGLAGGCMAMVTGAYVIVTFWQYRNACSTHPGIACYNVRDPLDLAVIAAATAGACIGFLWWNAAPAKIFMGDTGSLALGLSDGALPSSFRATGVGRDNRHHSVLATDRHRLWLGLGTVLWRVARHDR